MMVLRFFTQLFGIADSNIVLHLLRQSWAIYISLFSAMGMSLADTVILGHFNATDLAAVALGSGAFIIVEFSLFGILQAVAPLSAELYGAGHARAAGLMLQQALWLTFLIFIPGVFLLLYPDWFLGWANIPDEVNQRARAYLNILAWQLPAALFYRTFYAFCSALGKVKVLVHIGLIALVLHVALASFLAMQLSLGLIGCALSNVVLSYLALFLAAFWALKSKEAQHFQLFGKWYAPNVKRWQRLLKIGIPMGVINLIESSAFVFVSILLAPLGAESVGAYRVVGGLASILYLIPLSISVAVMAECAQALGAKNAARLMMAVRAGLSLAAFISCVMALFILLLGDFYVYLNTNQEAVIRAALPLLWLTAAYQFFDSVQTVMMHILRACRITFLPMLIQILGFWGIGLTGGYLLCYTFHHGAVGFFYALDLSLVFIALLATLLTRKILKSIIQTFPR